MAKEEGEGKKKLASQAGKFGIVGISNTLIDLGVFNLLTLIFGIWVVAANIISVSLAIINSYIWNKRWTFKNMSKDDIPTEFAKFVGFSLVGMAIQTIVVWFLIDVWAGSGQFAYEVVKVIKLDSIFPLEFVINNWAKVWGIGLALTWNFIAYKKWTFAESEK